MEFIELGTANNLSSFKKDFQLNTVNVSVLLLKSTKQVKNISFPKAFWAIIFWTSLTAELHSFPVFTLPSSSAGPYNIILTNVGIFWRGLHLVIHYVSLNVKLNISTVKWVN